jgi:tetratricopeptide (TPR) repeat protein
LDAALPLWRRTVELAPDYLPPQIRLGDIRQKRNETAAAAEIYSSILDRSPHDPFALVGLAQLDIAAGRWAEARARLELAATQPARVPARDLLAKVYERLGDTARADAEKSRAGAGESDLWDVPDPWVAGLMYECYDATQLIVASTIATDLATTRRYLDRAVSVDPGNAYARRQLGQYLFKQKEYAGARTHLERAVALAPAESDNWIYLITLLNKVGDDAAVQRALDAGLAQCPNSPSLHLELGRRLKTAGRLPEALAELTIARRLRPQEADAYVESADVYFRLNQLDLAADQLRDALAAVPDHPVALLLLAHSAIDNANEPEATRLIQRARQQLKIPPGDRSALVRDFQQRFGKTPP